jgi:hypothetical protein
MPYTISHAAAALPVHSLFRRLPLAALMIGSMAPDFAYFLPLGMARMETHSLAGVFLWALPMGLAVWLYFVVILERPTIAFLPDAWRTRMTPSEPLSWRSALLGSIAVVLGAFTHLLWDAFTHSSTFVTTALPGLYEEVFDIGGFPFRVYLLMQVLSSVLGLVILTLWASRIRRRPLAPGEVVVPGLTPRVNASERIFALLFIAALAIAVGFFNMLRANNPSVQGQLFMLLIGGMTGAMLGWSEVALAIRFRSHTNLRSSSVR